MLRPSPDQLREFRDAVEAAAGREDVSEAVRGVYDELSARIAQRRPICRTSGRCCRFDEFGHLLFVTTAEMAAFLGAVRSSDRPGQASQPPVLQRSGLPILPSGNPGTDRGSVGSCRFQVDGLCSVHAIRPFGCRVFFCDETAGEWQRTQYEQLHARIRAIHEELGVPYLYMEWRQALSAM